MPHKTNGHHEFYFIDTGCLILNKKGITMKMLTAIIKPFKLDEVREAIMDAGIAGVKEASQN